MNRRLSTNNPGPVQLRLGTHRYSDPRDPSPRQKSFDIYGPVPNRGLFRRNGARQTSSDYDRPGLHGLCFTVVRVVADVCKQYQLLRKYYSDHGCNFPRQDVGLLSDISGVACS